MKVILITNIPTPYRNPVYLKVSEYSEIDLTIFFCSKSEPNRNWKFAILGFDHQFLSSKRTFFHTNFNIVKLLAEKNPQIVITSGFNPTMIFAWFWAIIRGKKHISFSDANIHSESHLGLLHRLVRKLVYNTSHALIGASEKTFDLFRYSKIHEKKMFKSCLAINNQAFESIYKIKIFDLMFCGQFIDGKNPLFFSEIANYVSKKHPIRVLLVGNGPLKNECINSLEKNKVLYSDAGYVQESELPILYNKSRIFIFPTKRDAWGLVANEALAAGLPTIISSVAGAANELVVDGYNGYVINDYDITSWGNKTLQILNNPKLESYLSDNAIKSVKNFTFENAAEGIIKAIRFCME